MSSLKMHGREIRSKGISVKARFITKVPVQLDNIKFLQFSDVQAEELCSQYLLKVYPETEINAH